MSNHPYRDSVQGKSGQRAASWAFLGFLAIGAFFLLAEHRAHLPGWLPYILLALCPLLHLWHGRHGGHAGRDADPDASTRSTPPTHKH